MIKAKALWLAAVFMSVISFPSGVIAQNLAPAPLHALKQANAWLNSQPLSAADLKGKVVLVDFWTYTCINWRRTLPWLRAWDEKYRRDGLVIIGVHTPEFGFEKRFDNVSLATREQHVDYPVALDSDYAIWNAFQNQYWPALYMVDAQGRIREQRFGEGDYDELERVIQGLLAEAGRASQDNTRAAVEGTGAEAAADWKNLGTPESYVGYARAERLVSPGRALADRARVYAAPAVLPLNSWALTGYWTIKADSAVSHKSNGRISYRFHARDVHLVMGPGMPGVPIRFRVTIDGRAPEEAHGVDVDAAGGGTVLEPRMYQLIRQPGSIADRLLEIEFLDPGAQVYAFTFG